jgi:hypothetical protein
MIYYGNAGSFVDNWIIFFIFRYFFVKNIFMILI